MPNPKPTTAKPPLTDADRHKRFKEMAREVEASDEPEAFEKAFTKIVSAPIPKP